ncbi:MAG TPA: hypothetical protein VM052_06545 [Candidatus Limnocylindrales bacterium]|nr:hypothetical protein [Candidatus Limnocylindrales bacterium]
MDNVLYAVVAGAAIALLGFAARPRRGGQALTNGERVESLGWFLAATFLFLILQFAGVAREFAIIAAAAGVLFLIYMLGRRFARKPVI